MTPANPTSVILYVQDTAASVAFYRGVFAKEPLASSSPNYAMFALDSGLMLGLWARNDVQPTPMISAGAAELATALPDRAAVDACHAQWLARGVTIAQPPTPMDFGYTFTAQDPDGHLLRVMALHRA